MRAKEAELGVRLDAVGGLTLGADPISLALAIRSSLAGDPHPVHAFTVRKEPKDHGRGRQIEGPFQAGQTVVVVDDVITTGGSTLRAIDAVEREGGRVAFVLCLVNREEGGEEAIQARGIPVVSAFRKGEFVD
jgi:orotate phosphoribosyltransferase